MDLTLIATMLARGETPDLFHQEQQQYYIMAEDYRRIYTGREFSLQAFSESVYQIRLTERYTLPAKDFAPEVQCMERHKMVVNRHGDDGANPQPAWYFRPVSDPFVLLLHTRLIDEVEHTE